MPDPSPPRCPSCGSRNVKKIGESAEDSGILRWAHLPATKTVACRCECGTAYTYFEKVGDESAKAAAS